MHISGGRVIFAQIIKIPDAERAPIAAKTGFHRVEYDKGMPGPRMDADKTRIGSERDRMDAFYKRLAIRAATIDELLSDDFEPAPDGAASAELIDRRLAGWCRSAASGDWALFERRLNRDGLTLAKVKERFAGVRCKPSAPSPGWIDDAIWIEQALRTQTAPETEGVEPVAFGDLFHAVVERAEARVWHGIEHAEINLAPTARASLRDALLKELSTLSVPALYDRFSRERKTPQGGPGLYDRFIAEMKNGGWRSLFEEKPVLLRLLATVTRQWIEVTREFALRLGADIAAIRSDLVPSGAGQVTGIEGDISDPHNGGRAVRILVFADGSRLLYKPKDLRLDVAWHNLIDRLNRAEAPVDLKAVRVLARAGYGWTEFVPHTGTDAAGCKLFFRRAGAWLSLFHCFVAADMHQENMIASGDQPVPIDLETLLHASATHQVPDPEEQASDAATELLANSVMSVGLLPAYGRSPFNNVFAIGGLTSGWTAKTMIAWTDINSDKMRPVRAKEGGTSNPNLPFVDGVYAKFSDYLNDFISGFSDYARFLAREQRKLNLFDGFSGVPVRKVIRPTRFYYMLLQRLRNHQPMEDGAIWSAQADFIARLADWEKDEDAYWPLQRAERAALLTLNVPHFTAPSDGSEVGDGSGASIRTDAISGLARAQARVVGLDDKEIDWQIEVIKENTTVVSATPRRTVTEAAVAPEKSLFAAEAGKIAAELSRYAIRKGPGAAWIGLDWLGDADVFQLTSLGADLYNGNAGVALFLAAHAATADAKSSAELALAGLAKLRRQIKSRSAARFARSIGVGGGTGMGSIVYALAVIAKLSRDASLLDDANVAAALITDELIAADKQLDALGGSAGAILGLLRLYRDTAAAPALQRAVKCGDYLLAQKRLGEDGKRSWIGQGIGTHPLNGMSHGAAGFAYALSSLASASGRDDFAKAAAECVAFEDANYNATRHNWPDLRATGEPSWPSQWCHGAPGIGLARIATARRGVLDKRLMTADVGNAVEGVEQSWPGGVDTLCCGTLGNVEFLCEAADTLGRNDLRELAARRLAAVLTSAAAQGDYRWNSGQRRFNLGLFRGLAGVGYTALRQANPSLPNVLIWE
jgi:type 2 lantibiotic biosynthesis protein LanM